METITKTIETTGMIDILHHFVLDEPLPAARLTRIRGIILPHKISEIGEAERSHAASADFIFDFLKAPERYLYACRWKIVS